MQLRSTCRPQTDKFPAGCMRTSKRAARDSTTVAQGSEDLSPTALRHFIVFGGQHASETLHAERACDAAQIPTNLVTTRHRGRSNRSYSCRAGRQSRGLFDLARRWSSTSLTWVQLGLRPIEQKSCSPSTAHAQDSGKVRREFAAGRQREDVAHILVRSHDDYTA